MPALLSQSSPFAGQYVGNSPITEVGGIDRVALYGAIVYSLWLLRVRLFRVVDVVIWAWGLAFSGASMVMLSVAGRVVMFVGSRFMGLFRASVV